MVAVSRGSQPPPHGLYVCFLAGREGMFATDGAVAPGHEALGTDDLGGHRLNSQSTAMSPEGEIKPTRSKTKTPIGRVGTEKVRVQRGILFQNCMKRLKICVIERVTSQDGPQSGFPSGPKTDLYPERGTGGLDAKEECAPVGSRGMSRCRTDSISSDPCGGPASLTPHGL